MGSWDYVTVAALLLVFAMLSRHLESRAVTPAIFFTTAGVIAGPVLGIVELRLQSSIVKAIAEVALALVLFSGATRLSLASLRGEFALPLRLLTIGMPLAIAAGAAAGVAVLPGVSLVEALVLAVMLACTDSALGSAVVSDRRIPSPVRQGLTVESGLADGFGVPLFWIALGLAQAEEGRLSTAAAVRLVLEEIGYGTVAGLAAGLLGALALRLAWRRGWVEPRWLQMLTLASVVLAAGLADRLHGSMFVAAFVGGLVFGALRGSEGGEVTHFLDQGSDLASAVTFAVFGAVILGPVLDDLTWQIVLYALLSLTVVRMAPTALALLGTRARTPTTAFVGWFGPRGLTTLVLGIILVTNSHLPHEQTLLIAVAFTVGLSIFAHGLTARPLADRYVRWHELRPGSHAATDSS